MVSHIDGNANRSHHPGDVSPIASGQPSTMAWIPHSDASEIGSRPPLVSQQSSSLPSTPYQRARNFSFHSRPPSPARGNTSPRSTHSESTHLTPSARQPLGGCKYETAMAYFRRRIPYSLGADPLPKEKEGLKEKLEPEEEKRLTADIMDLYDRLLPSAESDDRRRQLVSKLEKLFNEQWPGHEIKAHVFGSSGNKLCSSESDVDICITTDFKELEHVCLLADVLAKHGMQRVVCVSHAKVPIVKIWDPELRLACDMNVNNTLALENTRMIRTYVEVDERVRPLAMSVKHWTKRRVLNDAALGGTLSSYTWICLIVNFLQTRNPPILPSLQARPHQKRATSDGVVYSFDDDLASLTKFGQKNKQTVGELFFEFFRYYSHELDYERNVISVREGGLISKEGKGWHFSVNNRLCVEEPFNTSRNLGNTADDTSFRGLHLELRRAFHFAAKGDLVGCCEQFEFPPEEERTWERPPPQPRPIITPSFPSRGGRGGGRGGRYANQFSRGGFVGGRRTSNTRTSSFRQPNSAHPADVLQQQAQFALHDQLYQQIQLLQAQEQELRMQLHNQALITGRAPPVLLRQPFFQFPMPQQQQEYSGEETTRSRSGTVNNVPITLSHIPATQRQQPFVNPTYASVSAAGIQGSTTSPPSPSATTTVPDFRRNARRSSVAANGSPKTSLRAKSQPARPLNSPVATFVPMYAVQQPLDPLFDTQQRPAADPSEGGEGSADENVMLPNSLRSNGPLSDSVDEGRPQEDVGYYLTPQQLQFYQQNSMLPPFSTPMGFVSNGCASYLPLPPDYGSAVFSSEGMGARSDQTPTPAPRGSQARSASSRPAGSTDRGPLIVDGSVRPSEPHTSFASDIPDTYTAATHYSSTSDEHNINTPASFSDSFSQDLQDVGPFEMDQTPVFSRPFDAHKMADGCNEPELGSTNGQPELLASRLQNYHLSNSEKLAQSQPTGKAITERHKNGSTNQSTGKDAGQSKHSGSNDRNGASGPQSANEVRRQPSTAKRRSNAVDVSEKINGVHHNHSHKGKPKGRPDATHHTSSAQGDTKDRNGDHWKIGGQTNGSTESHHGGWQTTKKKPRRNVKSSADPRNGINGGPEPLPADESLRKGG